ncbi:MAG: pirin family protein [Rhodospirillales bacterium]|nr:pirin family protein [Rhodospirillales bacterium]
MEIRHSVERGATQLSWLDSHHSFSFGEYHDSAHMSFGALRVINEDEIAPGGGFATHGHRDMEILTWVLDGTLAHRDSLGNGSLIRQGDLQRMTAGTGIRHSEFNASDAEPVHLLQIWIIPEVASLAPGYEQRAFALEDRIGRLHLIASRDGRQGSVTVHQDADLYVASLAAGGSVAHSLAPERRAWLQVARGTIRVNGAALIAGDGAAFEHSRDIGIVADDGPAEILLFDLA